MTTPEIVTDAKLPANRRFAAADGYAYTPESANSVLQEVYQWLHDGPMEDWDRRCSLHRRIGDMLGKKRVTYGE